jgi:hypothetical protein
MLLFAIHTNGYVPYLQSPTDYKLPLCSGDFDLLLDDAEVGSSNISVGNSSDVSFSNITFNNSVSPFQLEFDGLVLSGSKSYGWQEFIHDLSGETFRIYFYECCVYGRAFDYIIVDEPISQLPSFSGSFGSQSFLILDDLQIDDNVDFFNCEMLFGRDATMTIEQGMHLSLIDNTELNSYCDDFWDGVYALGHGTEIVFENAFIRNSAKGFVLDQDVQFQANNSEFFNNAVSLTITNFTLGGPFDGDSYIQVRGCLFFNIATTFFSPNTNSLADMAVYGGLNPFSEFIFVFSLDSYFQLGEENTTRNTLTSSGFEEESSITGVGVHGQNSELIITYNDILLLHVGIRVYETKTACIRNTHEGFNAGYRSSGYESYWSSQYIANCSFTYNVIEMTAPNDLYFYGHLGTHYLNNYHFKSEKIVIGNNAERHFKVNSNVFEVSDSYYSYLLTLHLIDGLEISNNEYIKPFSTNSFCLNLTETHGARVGENNFHIIPLGPPILIPIPVLGAGALSLNDVQEGQIKANYFNGRSDCIFGTGNLTGTLFSCNIFQDFQYGMRFVDAILSDQGNSNAGVDNQWWEHPTYNSTNRIYLDNITYTGAFWDYYHTQGHSHTFFSALVGAAVGGPSLGAYDEYFFSSPQITDCGVLNKWLPEERERGKLELYPNPTYDVINFQIETPSAYRITNGQGMLIKEGTLEPGPQQLTLPESSGLYFLQISNPSTQIVERIIKL